MATYQQILVAVDFSDECRQVIEKAQELAVQFDAQLTLLHVVEYTSTIYAGDIPLPEDLELDQRMAEQAMQRLSECSQKLALEGIQLLVEMGVPKLEIARIADQRGADLVVIGSHGRHGLQLLLGSTANGVLHQAKCDVLAVRVEGS